MPVALAIGLGSLAALAFLYSLAFAYKMSLGAMLEAIVAGIRSLPRVNLGIVHLSFDPLAKPFEAVDHFILAQIGHGIDGLQATWNYFWGWVAYSISETADAIAGTAEDTLRALHILTGHTIPKALSDSVALLKKQVYALEHRATATAKAVPATVTNYVTKVERVTVTKAVAVATALPMPRIGQLEREADALRKRIRSLAERFGPAALLGTVAVAVARLGFGWVRCAKVGRVGRQVCGMDESLLESLLAGAVLIAGTISLVEFAEGMQGIMGEIESPVRKFWRAT